MFRERILPALSCAALVLGCHSRAPSAEIAGEPRPAVSAARTAPLPLPAAAPNASSPALPTATIAGPPVPTPARSTIASRTSYLSTSDCAITNAAEVQCWSPTKPPATVPGLGGVDSLVANDDFTCARTTGGAVRCWGSGPFEAGTTESRPGRIKGLPDDVEAFSAGAEIFCARRRGGALRCLTKSFDELSSTWAWVARPGAQAVAKGGSLDCRLHPDGPVTCKGGEGQVVATLPGKYTALAISGWGVHGTAAEMVSVVDDGGRLRWVRGTSQFAQNPNQVVALPRPVVQIGAGVHHLCALLDDGSVHCWTGRPNVDFKDGGPVQSMAERAVELAVGDRHACARLESGKVACFGGEYTAKGAVGPRVILGG